VRNLYATSVTDDAFEFCAFVLAATTFVVTLRPKYTLTEQAVFFWTVCSVVNSFWFFDFTKTPTADVAWACKANSGRLEIVDFIEDLFRHTSFSYQIIVEDRCV
jgi:hypothetical protein